ncbi:uncharacterized protein LOC100181073 isoform X2 [Ciona intestinalis]
MESIFKLAILFGCLLLSQGLPLKTDTGSQLTWSIKDDGSYSFHAGMDQDHFTLNNADVFLQSNGKTYGSGDASLKLTGAKAISGGDATGTYEGTVYDYVAGSTRMSAQIAIYNGGEYVRFTQSFPTGVKGCNVSFLEDVLSSFPSFHIAHTNTTSNLGYLNMYGDMVGYFYAIGDIKTGDDRIRGGLRAGPLVLFDDRGNTVVMSSFSSFMSHNMQYDTKSGVVRFGVMGDVTEIPMHYQVNTILYYSDSGINQAIENWGRVLTTKYHKKSSIMEADFSINYLGYYTDNGAYYYYKTEPNKTYDVTMLDVVAYAASKDIPYGYLQYDSWWYYKGIGNGVKNWTSRPDIFPKGMDKLYEDNGLPVVAHNRYWSSDTTYAKQNGGKYNFYVETEKAIPADTNFWKDLIRSSKTWGLITYEQDWLDREFLDLKITRSNITVANNWLKEMGEAASECDVTIQYCMALPRHIMQSVEIQAVTQARVSGDYHPGNSQWKIGVTSMFAHALYIAPYKDTFWTTTVQSGSPYGLSTEPNTALQAAISTLSKGPVGPSDGIGNTDRNLLMKCCRLDGLILKPSRPITSTDETIMKLAFPAMEGSANAEAEVYTTYSDIHVYSSSKQFMLRFGILLITDLTTAGYSVAPSAMYLDKINMETKMYKAFQGHPGTDTKIYDVDATGMLSIPKCGVKDFQLWHLSPVVSMGNSTLVILGEREKWVPVSSRRITGVEMKDGNFLIDLQGKPTEVITMDFLLDTNLVSVSCTVPDSGTTRVSVHSKTCFYT